MRGTIYTSSAVIMKGPDSPGASGQSEERLIVRKKSTQERVLRRRRRTLCGGRLVNGDGQYTNPEEES